MEQCKCPPCAFQDTQIVSLSLATFDFKNFVMQFVPYLFYL